MLHHLVAAENFRECGSLAAEEAAQAAEYPTELGCFSGEDIVDHRVIGFRDFRFDEFGDRGDGLVGHFLAEAQRDEFFLEFVHGSKGVKSAGNRTRTCTPFDTRT